MNYEQLTSLFRVEERSVAFVAASLANVLLTIGTTILLVVVLDEGALGVVVGNFTGTLLVYLGAARLPPRAARAPVRPRAAPAHEPVRPPARPVGARALGAQLQRPLLPRAHRGPGGRRPLLARRADRLGDGAAAGRVPDRVARVRVLDRRRPRGARGRTRSCSPTSSTSSCWLSLALGVLAPWIVRLLARNEAFWPGADVVAPLAFAGALWGAYTVVAIGIGRLRRTQFNWVITGSAALVDVVAQPAADPGVRDPRRGGRLADRVHADVRRDGRVLAAPLPGAVPVAPRVHRAPHGRRR